MPVATSQDNGYKYIKITPLHVKNGSALFFNSIITEFSDSWTPRWSPTNVYGRMDPMSFYSGTGRELTLGFRVISDDRYEASENMKKIQRLLQYQYPSYTYIDKSPILLAPPYFKFRFLNAVGGSKGFIEGYINGAIQINPGFQSKDQAQYFSSNTADINNIDKILFSDVNIVLRIQVLHDGTIGLKAASGHFTAPGEPRYPYGVKPIEAQTAPDPPTDNTKTGDSAGAVDASNGSGDKKNQNAKAKNEEMARKYLQSLVDDSILGRLSNKF